MPNIIVHIGYAKAASSTLQKHLFHKLPDLFYLGIFPRGNVGLDYEEIDTSSLYLSNEKVRKLHDLLVFEENQKDQKLLIEIENYFNREIKPILNFDKIIALSNERLTSTFFSYPDIEDKAWRVKKIFPDAKILVILRNQFSMIKSQYRDHPFDPRDLLKGAPVTMDEWIEIAINSSEVKYLDSLKFNKILEIYSDLYGKENVIPLLFEDLNHNLHKFSGSLSKLFGIDSKSVFEHLYGKHENIGVSGRFNKIRSWKKRYLDFFPVSKLLPGTLKKRLYRYLKSGKKMEVEISPGNKKILNNYFRDSNSILMKQWNLNLIQYKYPLG